MKLLRWSVGAKLKTDTGKSGRCVLLGRGRRNPHLSLEISGEKRERYSYGEQSLELRMGEKRRRDIH